MKGVYKLYMNSTGASLNEPPPKIRQLALNFLATFFNLHLTEQQRHTSARAQKIFFPYVTAPEHM